MNKENVHEEYETIADWFDSHRSRDLGESKYLDQLVKEKPNGLILDLGCGMGDPIASYLLSKGEKVVGVDGSSRLLNKAQSRHPKVDWVCSDMRTYKPVEKFAAIITWHSLFHLSCDDQEGMIEKIGDWLLPNGIFIFTSGDEHGEVWGKNGGVDLYHASFSEAQYRDLLQKNGFKVLSYNRKDPDCGNATIWMTVKSRVD